jgi:hypothetical protein
MGNNKATGAAAVFGVLVDAPSDLYSIGRPGLDLEVVVPPTTLPTGTVGGAASGSLTGGFLYRVGFGTPDGAMTTPGPAKNTLVALHGTPTPSQDDLTVGAGPFTGFGFPVYNIEIDGTGPDTFKWKRSTDSTWRGTTVACATITGTLLEDGISAIFGGTTGHTSGDKWTITVTPAPIAATAMDMVLTSIETASGAGSEKVDRRFIERSDDSGATWAIVQTIYDNTTVTWTDDGVAVLDKSKVLPSINQTGANYGFTFLEPDSFDLEPEFSNLPVVALLGTAGKPRSIPGPIKIMGTPKSDLRPCDLLPILLSGAGLPDTYAQVTGEPTWLASWSATTGKRNARSISAFTYDGSPNVAPNFLYQLACEELDFTFAGGKIESIAPKITGANYGISAPAVPMSGNAGNYKGSFAAIGQRYDADALTKSVFIQITDVLAANAVKFQVIVADHSTGGTVGVYGGPDPANPTTSKFTLYRNDTSHNQTKGGLQFNDAVELTDQNGVYLGADVGSNRQPFMLVATQSFDTGNLAQGDIFEILPTAAVPGIGAAPFSGAPARFSRGPRFTDAHVTIYQDGEVIELTSGTLKFTWPKKAVNALCAGARTVQDLPNEGFFGVQITKLGYLDSSLNRNMIRMDHRAHIVVKLEGERIPINPGSLSLYREALYVDLPQVCFLTVKAPVTGQVLVVETTTAEAEQPDNPELDLYTIDLRTRQGWRIPS